MKKTIWLSYDLGLKGDYENLYRWLDSHQARECGNNIAVLKFEPEQDLVMDLTKDLKANVDFQPGNRVYITYRQTEPNKIKGKFIVGKRKPAPWAGYAIEDEEDGDDEE